MLKRVILQQKRDKNGVSQNERQLKSFERFDRKLKNQKK